MSESKEDQENEEEKKKTDDEGKNDEDEIIEVTTDPLVVQTRFSIKANILINNILRKIIVF